MLTGKKNVTEENWGLILQHGYCTVVNNNMPQTWVSCGFGLKQDINMESMLRDYKFLDVIATTTHNLFCHSVLHKVAAHWVTKMNEASSECNTE